MNKKINSMTDQQYFELLCQRINDASCNIAHTYDEYLRFAFVCSTFGEIVMTRFHKICAFDEKYDVRNCDTQFDNCQKTTRHEITLGTLVHIAQEHGIDVSIPEEAKPRRGRPRKTDEEREEERSNQFEQVSQFLNNEYSFRHNIISERI